MSLIEWKAEFSVGNNAVDHEHKELIDLINTLFLVMQRNGTRDEVIETLGEIFAQISAHFALEEKTMRDARYADLAVHKEDHEALLDQLTDIIIGIEENDRYEEQQLCRDMEHWFSEHFRTHDAKLHSRL